MDIQTLLKDGGFKSRKLVVVILAMSLVTFVGLSSGLHPNIQAIFATFCTAITSLVALYLGANSTLKYFHGKEASTKKDKEKEV